jgi:uncharacterized membrane protein YphA (DoxX/SURF4 family)
MEIVAAVAAVVVGAAFVVAGASKLAARDSWPSQARGLGAPNWVIPIVPWFELVVGALLIAQVARPLMALVAIALLAVFTAMIAVRLRQGRRPPCACFGAWSAKPIGGGHVVRNLALMAVAALALL